MEVGTCLSGGIDSSVLAVLMAEQTQKPVHCFTSVFKNETFNEEQYADLVSQKINAKHYKTVTSNGVGFRRSLIHSFIPRCAYFGHQYYAQFKGHATGPSTPY